MNRNSYKPPTMANKRPVDSRAPLHDLPPNGAIAGGGGGEQGGDVKRQRLNG